MNGYTKQCFKGAPKRLWRQDVSDNASAQWEWAKTRQGAPKGGWQAFPDPSVTQNRSQMLCCLGKSKLKVLLGLQGVQRLHEEDDREEEEGFFFSRTWSKTMSFTLGQVFNFF